MPVAPITSITHFQEAASSSKVIIYFSAAWCGPCKTIGPVLEDLSNEPENSVDFYKVDVDALPDIAEKYGVRAMPTFVFLERGNKVKDMVGANPGQLKQLVHDFRGR
ncbi:thioredoxin [Streptomyces sp. NPDC001492]